MIYKLELEMLKNEKGKFYITHDVRYSRRVVSVEVGEESKHMQKVNSYFVFTEPVLNKEVFEKLRPRITKLPKITRIYQYLTGIGPNSKEIAIVSTRKEIKVGDYIVFSQQ